MEFAFKLIKHSGILVLRVMGVLLPAAFGALASSTSKDGVAGRDNSPLHIDHGTFSDGTPYYTNSSDAQWETHYGDR
ncbi:MAG: hypothetical protein CVU36_12445 [Betaproteobacteria bacterium HGW-Betaproteobacteria-9]|jgi:hypothetical protein|nr:MAG: hypothetical protein CVU36_12445 [Betaproteobacteria bacterium HGW-Betaproteobacteria-9]